MILVTGAHGRLGQAICVLLNERRLAWKVGDARKLAPQDFVGVHAVIDVAAGMTPGRMRYHAQLAADAGITHYVMASSLLVTEYEQGRLRSHTRRHGGAVRKLEVERVLAEFGIPYQIVRLPPFYYGYGLHSRPVMILRSWYRRRSWHTPVSLNRAAQLLCGSLLRLSH